MVTLPPLPSLTSLPLTCATPSPAVVSTWRDDFHALMEEIGPRFARSEVRQHAGAYLSGLLSPVERKNSWQIADHAGETTPYALQHLLGRAVWEADEVRDDLQAYVRRHLADPEARLIIDETSFLKQGHHSVGVGSQDSGITGHIENGQVGVFLVYATADGGTFYDRELSLPKDWAADAERREQVGVPAEVRFATKPQVARRMVERALDSGLPVGWVGGDEVDGIDGGLRAALEKRQQRYALTISTTTALWWGGSQHAAREIVAAQPADAWTCLSAGEGSKGPRLSDWLRVRVNNAHSPAWERWLVARHSVITPDDPRSLAYFFVFAPADTELDAIALVLGQRWAIERGFAESKGEVGLDQYEVRSWPGWYRHITRALRAHAFLAVMRAQTHATDTPFLSPGAIATDSLWACKHQRGL